MTSLGLCGGPGGLGHSAGLKARRRRRLAEVMGHACNGLRCQAPLESQGGLQFRVGGATGLGGILLGSLNQLGETHLPLEVRMCPSCGHVELFRV